MAQRRMFSKTITSSSQFLMMPQSSQNLYFHLGMNADDDGFCEHFTIMRMTESKPDDLKVLQSKNFIKVFDEKVLIIVDWKENNYLRSDRYTPSKYLDIYRKEVKKLSTERLPSGIPVVDEVATQVRIGKDRVVNTTEQSSDGEFSLKDEIQKLMDNSRRELRIIGWFLHEKKVTVKNKGQLSVTIRRHLRAAKLLISYEVPQLKSAADNAERQLGNKWTLETLYKLLTK